MTSILCANCELPISLGESFTQALEGRHQHLHPDQCIRLLRAELAEAVRLQEKYYGALQSSNAAAGRRGERIKELEADNTALREDKARLDDMERLLADKDWPVFAFEYMDNKPIGLTMVRCFEPEYACGNTIREAIDAVRKAE